MTAPWTATFPGEGSGMGLGSESARSPYKDHRNDRRRTSVRNDRLADVDAAASAAEKQQSSVTEKVGR